MAKRKSVVPKDESKRDTFKRIVQPRVRKAIKAIRLIGNCSGSAYEYTEKDVAGIVAALNTEIEGVVARYQSTGVSDVSFNLE